RNGKDTVAQLLTDLFGFTFQSSSVAASEIFLYDALKDKYHYTSPEECLEDRVNHRPEWHDLYCEYNKKDPARVAKEILKSADIYVGMRSDVEAQECLRQGIFDIVIGVYDPRKPLEPSNSFNIDLWKTSDIVISNAGTLKELKNKVIKLRTLLVP